jgi:WD40 repeat protein
VTTYRPLPNELLSIDVATGTAHILVGSASQAWLEQPSFYPGLSRILLRVRAGPDPPGIWSLDLKSSQLSFVTSGYSAELSPDGTLLAVFVGPSYEMKNEQHWAIRLIPTSGNMKPADIFTSSVQDADITGLAWSPDSTKLAFTFTDIHIPVENSTNTLKILSLSGTVPSQWPTNLSGYIDPAWSPSGGYLATIAASSNWGPTGRLVIWALATSCYEELTGPDDVETPAWSPDGTRLAFVHHSSLYMLDLQAARTAGRLVQTCK